MLFLISVFNSISWKLILRPYYRKVLGQLGSRTYLPYSTKLEFPSNIYIGAGVSIGKMTWLASNPLTNNPNPRLIIGDGTYLGNFAHIYCTSGIEIGKNVLFADKVYVSDNLHSFEEINIPIIFQPIKQVGCVSIGDGAWIGENVCIVGANIGRQCVIGANSYVNKSIPDYCVAVGSPAKIIKRYSFDKHAWCKTDAIGNFIEI